MVNKDIQFNTYKIRLLTGETKNLKDKMFDIQTLANDIDNKIKEAMDREVLFCLGEFFFFQYSIVYKRVVIRFWPF